MVVVCLDQSAPAFEHWTNIDDGLEGYSSGGCVFCRNIRGWKESEMVFLRMRHLALVDPTLFWHWRDQRLTLKNERRSISRIATPIIQRGWQCNLLLAIFHGAYCVRLGSDRGYLKKGVYKEKEIISPKYPNGSVKKIKRKERSKRQSLIIVHHSKYYLRLRELARPSFLTVSFLVLPPPPFYPTYERQKSKVETHVPQQPC